MWVEEKGHDADERDAVLAAPWLFVGIAGLDDFPEVVADVAEREGLLFALLGIGALEISWISPRNFKCEFALAPSRSPFLASFGGAAGGLRSRAAAVAFIFGRENAIWQFHALNSATHICRRFVRRGWRSRRMPRSGVLCRSAPVEGRK